MPPTPRPRTSPSATRSTSAAQAMEVVGIVASTSSDADTAANVYIPLDVAQALSGAGDVVSTVYVQAAVRRCDRGRAGRDRRRRCPTPRSARSPTSPRPSRARSRARRRSSRTSAPGSRSSCSPSRVALAVLFTISGVSRRTREFGTLKAIGWSNRRVVGQVAGESVVQGLHRRRRRASRLGLVGICGDQRRLADDLDRPAA